MKWTVLTDNRSKDPSFKTEHGLSILLETNRSRILLDTGASDVFIDNAKRMGIDLGAVDYVFISHGHNDHAGGLCIRGTGNLIRFMPSYDYRGWSSGRLSMYQGDGESVSGGRGI